MLDLLDNSIVAKSRALMMCVCRGRKFDGGSSAKFLQALHAADTEVGTGPEAGPERGAPAFHCCASWSQGGAR